VDILELSKVHWQNTTETHIEALATLVEGVLNNLVDGEQITTSELLRRLQTPMGAEKGLSGLLARVRQFNPRWASVDPKRTFMKKPCYLWHLPAFMTEDERRAELRKQGVIK
jgi:hypothetical protein